MYNLLGNVTIVGVVETYADSPVEIWIDNKIYSEISRRYFESQIFDSYELVLTDITYSDLEKCVNDMQVANIYIDEPNIKQIYATYDRKDSILDVGVILVMIFLLLAILLNVSFMSYSVSDNHSKIGILRALGVNKKTISLIFVYESLFVSVISFASSYMLANVAFSGINSLLVRNMQSEIIFFYRNYALVISIFIFAIMLGILCVVLPVLSLSKAKAINLIRNSI